MMNIDKIWINISCSKCKYKFSVQLIDIKLESIMYCDNCKCQIKLKDKNSSVHNAIEGISCVFTDFEQTLKNLLK